MLAVIPAMHLAMEHLRTPDTDTHDVYCKSNGEIFQLHKIF